MEDGRTNTEARVALIQLAVQKICTSCSGYTESSFDFPASRCWVIDVCATDTQADFSREVASTCHWLFNMHGNTVLIGFAFRSDLRLLRRMVPELAPYIIDLQEVAIQGGVGS